MRTGTRKRKRKKKAPPPEYKFGKESNGILMTPQEFDAADPDDFDELWDYELINGVLVVSPIPMVQEADMNDELGCMLRDYGGSHSQGNSLDATLPRRYIKAGANRRFVDRVIWMGLGRLPLRGEAPKIVVEFVSSHHRCRDRDHDAKRDEFRALHVRESWIIDRFRKAMMVHFLGSDKDREKTLRASQTYRTERLPGFELPLRRLFELADRWADAPEDDTHDDQYR